MKKTKITENKKKGKNPGQNEKEKRKPSATDQKIKALLDFAHIEELFYTLSILNEKELSSFLEHYKKSEISPSKDKKIDMAIRSAENIYALLDNIKQEITKSLEEEIKSLNEKISALRKHGKDTYIEETRLLATKPKVQLFSATAKKEDFYRVKKILFSIEEKIKSLEEQLGKELAEKEQKAKAKEEQEKKEKETREKIKKGEDISEKKSTAKTQETRKKPK